MNSLPHKLAGFVTVSFLIGSMPKAFAQPTQHIQIQSFSVGPDAPLTYPNSPTVAGHLNYLPENIPPSFRPPQARQII